ncbi:hypothetical protein LTR94_031319, partial [Friedmanniomyces endolithicus]
AAVDVLDGGAGNDTLDYATSATAVSVNLATGLAQGGDAQGDLVVRFENLMGSDFDDVLTGDAGANRLRGGAGDDRLAGAAGADVRDGGAGSDTADSAATGAAVTIDLAAGTLTRLPAIPSAGFGIEAACMYRDAQNLDHVFLVGADGQAQQWLLGEPHRLVRRLALPTGVEHCLVDD